jgi:hypothetical protein
MDIDKLILDLQSNNFSLLNKRQELELERRNIDSEISIVEHKLIKANGALEVLAHLKSLDSEDLKEKDKDGN